MPILTVRHLTRYSYRRPVAFGEHRMMFRPREGHDQRVLSHRLVITPEPISLRLMHDVFGNCVAIARFDGRADALTFDSTVELDHRPAPLEDEGGMIDAAAAHYPGAYSAEDTPDLLRSIEREHPDPDGQLERWARAFLGKHGQASVLDLLSDMTRTIHSEFGYAARLEPGVQSPLETLRLRTGSCRDFAVLMVEAARSLNLAARFVSGYIYSTAPGRRERTGGGHTHAWACVYLPQRGWVEFDPTNGIVGSTDLIRVAVARTPAQALPLVGAWTGSSEDYVGMDVEVDVRLRGRPTAVRRAA
jgi:transglutaminase-like putative cysteine protease